MNTTPYLDVRITIELPTGKREVFGYRWPEHHMDGRTFVPLPRDREIDQFAMMEAQAQRDRSSRIAKVIAANIAEAILEAAEKNDTVRGYPTSTATEGKR